MTSLRLGSRCGAAGVGRVAVLGGWCRWGVTAYSASGGGYVHALSSPSACGLQDTDL